MTAPAPDSSAPRRQDEADRRRDPTPPGDPDERVGLEQLVYARWLDVGMKMGLAIAVLTLSVYVFGLAEPVIPLQELPAYWSLPVNEYLQQAGVGQGWSWLWLVHRGDFMNFVGIAVLSAVTIVCYLRIIPVLYRAGDGVFVALVALTAAVLLLAASGLLVVGH
jgi:hypothetical protein